MSIINQTLRELDVRKADSAPRQVSLRPAAAVLRRRSGLWAAGTALLPVAGLLVWFMSQRIETPPPLHPGTAPRAAVLPASHRAAAAPSASPAAAVAPAPAPVESVADASPVKRHLEMWPPEPVPDRVLGRSGLSLTMQLSPPAEQPPLIRKEADEPAAEDEADERYRKAVTLMQKGRENQARPLLEEAIKLSPEHAAARQMLATLLSEAGQNREAETVLREGRSATPDNAWFALSLARLQAVRGDVEGAVTTLQDGAAGRGVNAEYRATLAALLVRLKQYAEAARQYQQALKQQPGEGTWWLGLALSMEAQGKTSEAHSAYSRALAAGNLPEKLVTYARTKVAE